MENNKLIEILNSTNKIREITHQLREYLNENKERIHILFNYILNSLKRKEISFDLTFLLFCCSADSIKRTTNNLLKKNNWEKILKKLLNLIKLYSKVIKLEKYENALVKVSHSFSLFLSFLCLLFCCFACLLIYLFIYFLIFFFFFSINFILFILFIFVSIQYFVNQKDFYYHQIKKENIKK